VPPEPRIGLLDAEPDLGRFLSEDEARQAARVTVTVRPVRGVFDSVALLQEVSAFGALIIEGMVLHRLQLAEQPTVRLFGPGDLVSAAEPGTHMPCAADSRAVGDTRVAILDDRVLAAAQRWPRMFAALHQKAIEQTERTALQLAICQLPRVTDRLLALMWLLAESWGRVTASGVTLPIALTHDMLGGMIGARRPTVTLALGELSDRGAIVKQDLGWLLLERPTPAGELEPTTDIPVLFDSRRSAWSSPEPQPPIATWTHAELMASIARLHAEHLENRERVRQRLAAARVTRDRVRERRLQITSRRRRQAPSS
jgi:CRP-like cAMP-binding protein